MTSKKPAAKGKKTWVKPWEKDKDADSDPKVKTPKKPTKKTADSHTHSASGKKKK